jgi:hypothetical protein
MINSAKSGAACALSDRLLTLPDGPGRFWPCVSRFLVKSPALKLSPPGPVFAKSGDCDESMDAAAGANAKALPAYDYPMARSTLLSYTGTKLPGSDARNSKSSTSLEKRKIYVALRDAAAEKHNMLRIVDESGEDYLYPKAFFRSIALPQSVRRAVLAA